MILASVGELLERMKFEAVAVRWGGRGNGPAALVADCAIVVDPVAAVAAERLVVEIACFAGLGPSSVGRVAFAFALYDSISIENHIEMRIEIASAKG
jgi:hypothetical protein